jgi:hypothetical protein
LSVALSVAGKQTAVNFTTPAIADDISRNRLDTAVPTQATMIR